MTCTECRSNRLSTAKALGVVPTNGGQCLIYRWLVQSRLYLSTRSLTCTECRSTRLSTAKALGIVPTNGGQCLLYRWFVQSRLYLSTRSVTCTECRSTRLSTAKALALCQQMGDSVSFTDGLYKGVYFAEMIIQTSVASQDLSGCMEAPYIYPHQLLRELVPPQNVKHLGRVQFVGFDPAHYRLSTCSPS